MPSAQRDLARITLVVLAIGGLLATSLWILMPFLPALIWAIMIVVATWPLLLWLQKRLWKRRWLAVTAVMIALVIVFMLPFWLAISAIVSNAEEIAGWAKSLSAVQLPLTLIIAGVLYFWGEASAQLALRFGHRLAGERGERAISLAGRAIRAVALGVVLTALAQSILGGVALAIAGVPFAAILTSVMFLLALAQIGAVPVLLCAAG